MYDEQAECGSLTQPLNQLGEHLDLFLLFEHPDAMCNADTWKAVLGGPLPEQGISAEQVIVEIGAHLIPNGSQIPKLIKFTQHPLQRLDKDRSIQLFTWLAASMLTGQIKSRPRKYDDKNVSTYFIRTIPFNWWMFQWRR